MLNRPSAGRPSSAAGRRFVALWALALALASTAASGQETVEEHFSGILRRQGLEEYSNYAEYQYRPYRRQLRQDISYNFFGEFLADGFRAFRLQEQRPGYSLIAKDEAFRSFFNNLVIVVLEEPTGP